MKGPMETSTITSMKMADRMLIRVKFLSVRFADMASPYTTASFIR